jgi:tripeptidyl-peptidase-1
LTTDNGTNPQSPDDAGVEANLDIQYTVGAFLLYEDSLAHSNKSQSSGIATGVPVEFLSVGGSLTLDDFPSALLDTTTFLDGIANPPTVMTTSYAYTESFFGLSLATYVNFVA